MIPKIILKLHPLIFQYLFHRRKWGLYLEELVAASLRSPFHRANTCGNDECFGCIVQLKEASSQNRRTKGSGGDAIARNSTHTQTTLESKGAPKIRTLNHALNSVSKAGKSWK